MKKISRRSFLKASVVATAAASLAACGQSVTASSVAPASSEAASSEAASSEATADAMKIGYIYIGDDSEAYTANFIAAENAVKEKFGDAVTTIAKYNVAEDAVEGPALELCEAGCSIIFSTSFGYGEKIKEIAASYPEIEFCQATCADANAEPIVENYTNAMGTIYQARYVAGIVAGMKIAEQVAAGAITGTPKIGYVGAFPYAEVISGYTAFFLGARSVVADVTMDVVYSGTWGDFDTEKTLATSLIDGGCCFLSQHSDTEGPAEACEDAMKAGNPVFCIAYNQDMTDVAPNTCLISSRIDWAPYQLDVVQQVMDGKVLALDTWHGFDQGWIALTDLNTAIAAEGTQEAIDTAIAAINAGEVEVFKGAYTGTNPWAEDDKIDLSEGYIENEIQSAPAFGYVLDEVITVLNND